MSKFKYLLINDDKATAITQYPQRRKLGITSRCSPIKLYGGSAIEYAKIMGCRIIFRVKEINKP